MIYDALDPKQSSEGPHEEAPLSATAAPTQTSPGSRINDVSGSLGFWKPLQDAPEDPRPTLLALLSTVSDIELFLLLTRRVAVVRPYGPPLYLTPYCIEGMHNFLIPERWPVESLPEHLAAEGPFSKIPRLPTERRYLNMDGHVTGSESNERADAMLVSLAMLLHFLSPQELKMRIRSRVAVSEAPHEGIRWFIEFMTSGGDGVPRGKLHLDEREAMSTHEGEQRRDNAAKKLPGHLQTYGGELYPGTSAFTGRDAVLPSLHEVQLDYKKRVPEPLPMHVKEEESDGFYLAGLHLHPNLQPEASRFTVFPPLKKEQRSGYVETRLPDPLPMNIKKEESNELYLEASTSIGQDTFATLVKEEEKSRVKVETRQPDYWKIDTKEEEDGKSFPEASTSTGQHAVSPPPIQKKRKRIRRRQKKKDPESGDKQTWIGSLRSDHLIIGSGRGRLAHLR